MTLDLDDFMIHSILKSDTETLEKYREASLRNQWVPQYRYELYGVVCHSGSMSGGHYVAYTCYNY